MIRRLQKNGNSLSLTIPPAVLELLHITPETDLHITTDGHQLFIKPAGSKPADHQLEMAIARTITNHGATLRKLAK